MLTRLDIITRPAFTLVSLGELKQYVRVDDDADDAQLMRYLIQTVELAQEYLERQLMTYTYKWTIAEKPIKSSNTNYYGSAFGWQACPLYWSSIYNQPIELPRTPVQQVLSVSRGYYGQAVDTFLTENVDYAVDLQTDPARIAMLSYTAGGYQDHMSVVFTTGYGMTNVMTISGTATATASLGLTVGGQTVTVAVTTGDTATTVLANALAAVQAIPNTPSMAVITPTMAQLRGPNPAIVVTTPVDGITVAQNGNQSDVPISILEAIKYRTAQLYTNQTDSESELSEWFYESLKPWRNWAFFS